MGIVTSVQDYGAFVKLEKTGIEGLVHQSEIDHLKKNIHPSKVLSVSQRIPVRILDIDQEKNRLSLSFKRTMQNPWDAFSQKYKNDSWLGVISACVSLEIIEKTSDEFKKLGIPFGFKANLWGVEEPLPVHRFNTAGFNEIGKNS